MARIAVFPPAGIVRGATPNVSAGLWFDANLMRWRQGQAQPIGGNAALPGASFGAPGRDVMTWHDLQGRRWAVAGTDAALWVYNFELAQQWNITPAGVGPLEPPGAAIGFGLGDYGMGAYGTARDASQIGPQDASAVFGDRWSLDLFGEDLMIVPTQDGHLFRWTPNTTGALPVVVATAPARNTGVFVTDERHVVLIGAGGDPRAVAWSDQENPDVWTVTVSNMAGSKELVTEGRALTARRVTGGNLIWTDNDVHLMRYSGPPYAYGITKIGANCGPISPRAVAQAGGVTQWMGLQSFWQYNGSVIPLPCDVGDWLFSLINRDMVGRVFGAANPSFTELWWYWPDESAAECNRYVALNYGDKGTPWIIGQEARTAADISGAMIRPILAAGDGGLYMHEYGWLNNGASRRGLVYLETGDLQLATLGGDPDRRFHVRQLEEDFVGPAGAMGYRFFLWEEPNGPQWDTGSFPVLDNSGLVDARFSCRGCRMRIEGLDDGPFAVGKTRLISRPGGKR